MASACEDDPTRGPRGVCDTPAGALVGCDPTVPPAEPLTIEQACWRLVECGAYAVTSDQTRDYQQCVNELRGDEFSAERLRFVLDCVAVSTCQDLDENHCTNFGSGDPQ
jgi:hypothetical protein